MKRTIWIAPFAALLLAACDGDDGVNGTNGASGSDGFNSLVATRTVPKGDATCAGGGKILESGLDGNRNGTLDAGEATHQEYLQCLTAPRLRALHASPDAPRVNILVNGTQVLGGVDFAQGSGFLAAAERSRVQVEAIVPGGNAVVIDENLSLQFSTDYTVIATGEVADPIDSLLIGNPTDSPITPGNLRAQVVHAAAGAPPVDVYVTAPGASLASSAALNDAPLAFQQFTGRAELPAGTYQVRVTLAGNPATVVYDSGELALSAATDLLIAAVANTGPGTAPIQLVALDGQGANTLLDAATPAAVIAVHASPDAPAVDVLADDDATAMVESLALARNVAFPEACRIGAVPAPGNYGISVTAAGNPSVVALQFDLAPAKADVVTAIVTGYLGGAPAIQPLALATNVRSVATEAKLRITHASPGTGAVDLYLLADGADLGTATPNFAAVPFAADTGVLSIPPGTYDIYVTPAGNPGVVAIEVQDFALTGGEVLDVIARDALQNGSEGALPQLIVVDHANIVACPT
jgi:trimeric autotransporter adhesin